MNNYDDFYNRQIMLWGKETQDSLKSKSITIVGSGGLGCSLAYALSASGIGHINIVDFDTVSENNIHRQIAFDTDDIGEFKVDVVAKKMKKRSPFVSISTYKVPFNKFISSKKSSDIILDATDNLFARGEIDEYSKSIKTPWIYSSVEAYNGYVCLFKESKFSENIKIMKREPAGITAPIVMLLASFEANIALRYLANLPIKSDYLNYLYFDNFGELKIKGFSLC